MEQPQNNFQYFVRGLSGTIGKILLTLVFLVLIALVVVGYLADGTHLSLGKKERVSLSPTQIQSIRNIGQWEFLSVSDEELVDTVRYGFFGDNQLARIYYGTLRIGIDLSEFQADWVTVDGDSVSMQLPDVHLLDDNFIDEARTRSFYESGKWTHADRERMYQTAVATMKQRCLTETNIQSARENAQRQLSQLLSAMGFKRISVRVGQK